MRGRLKNILTGLFLALPLMGNGSADVAQICASRPFYLTERAPHEGSLDSRALRPNTRVAVVPRAGTNLGTVYDCSDTSHPQEYTASMASLSTEPVPQLAETATTPETAASTASTQTASPSSHSGEDGEDCTTMVPERYRVDSELPTRPHAGPTGNPAVPLEDRPVTEGGDGRRGRRRGHGGTGSESGPIPSQQAVIEEPVVQGSPGVRTIARREEQLTGVTSGRSAFNSPIQPANIERIQDAIEASDNARGSELVDSALSRLKAMGANATQDRETLSRMVHSSTMDQAVGLLDHARGKLERAANFLTEGEFAGAGAAETGRFRNLFMNARDRAEAGARIVGEQLQKKAIQAQSPFLSIFGQHLDTTSQAEKSLSEVFGAGALDSDTSNDALVNRMIVFNSLSEKDQREALNKLKLAENKNVILQNGQTVTIPLLHNGYFFGGGESSLDCSSFVSRILPSEVRQGSFTTLDFRMMWLYGRSGKFPAPPKYKEDRKKLVIRTTNAFIPIDLYVGDRLQVGDLLIFRLPWKTAGHVFIVKDFDPQTLNVRVIEAAQSAGTIRERDFGLSVDPMGKSTRRVRPGLFALRLKPVSTEVCSYKGARTESSAARRPVRQPVIAPSSTTHRRGVAD